MTTTTTPTAMEAAQAALDAAQAALAAAEDRQGRTNRASQTVGTIIAEAGQTLHAAQREMLTTLVEDGSHPTPAQLDIVAECHTRLAIAQGMPRLLRAMRAKDELEVLVAMREVATRRGMLAAAQLAELQASQADLIARLAEGETSDSEEGVLHVKVEGQRSRELRAAITNAEATARNLTDIVTKSQVLAEELANSALREPTRV